MNRNQDFDETVANWLDEGADRAPERFVWAAIEDVERTGQRGAWRASTEEFIMQLKRAAPFLGIAATVVLAIVAYQAFATPRIGVGDSTPRRLSSADLPEIVVTEANVPDGLTVHRELNGREALSVSETAPVDSPGFVDALLTDFDRDEDRDNGRYGTFAAVFDTEPDAERAYDAAVANHESPEGWALDRSSGYVGYDPDPGLGDESVYYVEGMAYGHPELGVYLWRVDNVLLHAVGLYLYWEPDELRSIAEGMDARAQDGPSSSQSPAGPARSGADLEAIVVTGANVPSGLTVHRTLTGLDALRASDTAAADSLGFVDALLTDFDRDAEHEGPHEGRYGSFAAVFATVADAERAYDAARANHESPDGWGLTTDHVNPPGYDPDPGLGDESVYYIEGLEYGIPELAVYLWRVDNVLLHAIDVHPYDDPDLLRSIVEDMDARASGQ